MLRLLAAFCLAVVACGNDPASPPEQLGDVRRVLFLGNSLTNTNGLPSMVRVMAESAGIQLEVQMVAPGGVSLEDHWNSPATRELVATGDWDVVVLQQGPSAWPSSRANLREYAIRWGEAIRDAGARPVVYMPWPESWRRSAFDSVSRSYREAAQAIGAPLVPGGDAWLAAWRRDPALPLYGDDGFHPSRLGTWVVAVATWSTLTGRPAAEAARALKLPDGPLVVPASAASLAREAVAEVLR